VAGRHTQPFDGQGNLTHQEFLVLCQADAENHRGALQLVVEKAQEALNFYSEKAGQDYRDKSQRSSMPAAEAGEGMGLDVFEGRRLGCSVKRYVKRILKYGRGSVCNLVIAFLFLERIKRLYDHMELTPHNLQRLLLTASMVACKMYDDVYYSNKHWAEIGELTSNEMQNLELKFLGLLNFNCRVQPEEYQQFVASLHNHPRLLAAPHEILRPLPSVHSRMLSVSMSHCSPSASAASSICSGSDGASMRSSMSALTVNEDSPAAVPAFERRWSPDRPQGAPAGRRDESASSVSAANTRRTPPSVLRESLEWAQGEGKADPLPLEVRRSRSSTWASLVRRRGSKGSPTAGVSADAAAAPTQKTRFGFALPKMVQAKLSTIMLRR